MICLTIGLYKYLFGILIDLMITIQYSYHLPVLISIIFIVLLYVGSIVIRIMVKWIDKLYSAVLGVDLIELGHDLECSMYYGLLTTIVSLIAVYIRFQIDIKTNIKLAIQFYSNDIGGFLIAQIIAMSLTLLGFILSVQNTFKRRSVKLWLIEVKDKISPSSTFIIIIFTDSVLFAMSLYCYINQYEISLYIIVLVGCFVVGMIGMIFFVFSFGSFSRMVVYLNLSFAEMEFRYSHFDKASKKYTKIIKKYEKCIISDLYDLPSVYLMAAQSCIENRDLETAQKMLRRVSSCIEIEMSQRIEICISGAQLFWNKKRVDEALILINEAYYLFCANSIEDKDLIFRIYIWYSILLDDVSDKEKYLNMVIDNCDNDSVYLSLANQFYGRLYFNQKEYKKAIECFDKCLFYQYNLHENERDYIRIIEVLFSQAQSYAYINVHLSKTEYTEMMPYYIVRAINCIDEGLNLIEYHQVCEPLLPQLYDLKSVCCAVVDKEDDAVKNAKLSFRSSVKNKSTPCESSRNILIEYYRKKGLKWRVRYYENR